MKNEIGLWVDHRKAVIVTLDNQKETVQIILSTMEKHTRFSSGAHSDTPNDVNGSTAEDIRDRQFDLHLGKYYSDIAFNIRDADSILIFGPGEAKVEFASFLKKEKLDGKIAAIETVDKMTDRQIAAKVHDYFIHA
jgi:stalled ribosome rescue protein Dom34